MKISSILATKGAGVVTIGPDETLKQALAELAEHNFGALVVVNDSGAPIGILSERDIARLAARQDDIGKVPVSAAMTKQVIMGSPHDDLSSVLRTMTEGDFRHLPILDDGRLAGIVSIGDVVKAQLNQYQGEIETLETRITKG